jgi:formyltetrahydrofolate deformylase
MSTSVTLRVVCQDRTGLVATLSDFVFRNGGNILDADQHTEESTGTFTMRLAWSLDGFQLDREGIRMALDVFARRFGLRWRLDFSDHVQQVAIFASTAPHCLYDLLLRERLGELEGGAIACVIANHDELREISEHFGKPFHRVAVTADTKDAAEVEQQRLLAEHHIDLVVLARYMQVLSPAFVAAWPERIINIHHSFLPAFVGAKPYHQAKERGVKIIGATAHYVTADLDQGPIIEQDVARVSHRDEVDDLVRKGRDLERQVLARAVRAHLDHRVLVESGRTVVFR